MIKRNMTTLRKLMLLNGAIGGILSEDTAIGNPLTFLTDLSKPLKSLLIPFTPKQSGTGDPSPQNIRPLLPWNGLTVFGGGKNLLNTDGIVRNSYNIGGFVNALKPNTKYTISINGTTDKAYRLYMTTESAPLSGTTPISAGYIFAGQKETFTTPSEMTGILVLAGNSAGAGNVPIDSILPMIVAGSTKPSAYEPYHPITDTDIVFPSPVYGGSAEIVSGAMIQTVLFASAKWKDFEGNTEYTNTVRKDLVIPYNCLYGSAGNGKTLCNMAKYKYNNDDDPHFYLTDAKRIRCFMPKDMDGETEITFTCTLAEPIPLESIEPHHLTALIGDNTIWSDADGSMTATYLKKG